ncbi:hypothetical protein CPB85DRAFT_1282521 [Mucidula mucida]|nr:hypothetical protein CPB85DRAFT_1282521 [Mucidula mucida]
MKCSHDKLSFTSSTHAEEAGYTQPTASQRINATTLLLRSATSTEPSPAAFPAPLVLPNDDLALDPRYPPQSLRSFTRLKERNKVTPERKTLYVAGPPSISSDIEVMQAWCKPKHDLAMVPAPNTKDVIEYLTAFYSGMDVKALPHPLSFTHWSDAFKTLRVGLATATECVGIRTRPSHDGTFLRQLNLDDLLDAAIDILPADAYALLLLVEHDIYENDDDDFACGRAYGGSRVAVVSMARYNPGLDAEQEVVRDHSWPASHCERYMQQLCCEGHEPRTKKRKTVKKKLEAEVEEDTTNSPMRAALDAYVNLPSPSPSDLSGLWLGRVCKTASHELGHCFGMDHCVYYACIMQGTASLVEDARQPPYLCPVDLSKLLHAAGCSKDKHYASLLEFCDRHKDVHLFSAFRAWLDTVRE